MERVSGKRFSHIYLDRGVPSKDNDKFRFRISKLFDTLFPDNTNNKRRVFAREYAINQLELESGISFIANRDSSSKLFFEKLTLCDLLDSITIITNIYTLIHVTDKTTIIDIIKRILSEENMAYEIDDFGGIHPLIDSEFSVSKQTAIISLLGDRYIATRLSVEATDANLLENPPNYKEAIRKIFSAMENLYKLMYRTDRLTARDFSDKIRPHIQKIYSGDPLIISASGKIITSITSWIDAVHNYRHEPGREEPLQPDGKFTILLISQGFSFIRWLAEIDKEINTSITQQ